MAVRELAVENVLKFTLHCALQFQTISALKFPGNYWQPGGNIGLEYGMEGSWMTSPGQRLLSQSVNQSINQCIY